ncbi:MAG: 7-cyano-7-deazaguanine synthase [Candidatus Anstonellales archaeon]
MKNKVVLFSAGIDSLATALKLPDATMLYFKAGFSHTNKDLRAISKISRLLKRKIIVDDSLNLGKFETQNFDPIFCKNLLFATIAGNYGDEIYLGAIRGDNALDKNPEAFKEMSKILTELGGKKLLVKSILWNKTKTEIIKDVLTYPKGKELLLSSVSCYAPTTKHCGKCGSCFRRWVGMVNNNIDEKYENNPAEWGRVPVYIQKMKKGLYDFKRTKETFAALRKVEIAI